MSCRLLGTRPRRTAPDRRSATRTPLGRSGVVCGAQDTQIAAGWPTAEPGSAGVRGEEARGPGMGGILGRRGGGADVKHLKTLRTLDWLYAFGLAYQSVSDLKTDFESIGDLVLTVVVMVPVCILVAILGFRVEKGRWRIVQTIVAATGIFFFPVGTAYGGYALWVCWVNRETKEIFASKQGVVVHDPDAKESQEGDALLDGEDASENSE